PPCHPMSPLFPYTTLFRSHFGHRDVQPCAQPVLQTAYDPPLVLQGLGSEDLELPVDHADDHGATRFRLRTRPRRRRAYERPTRRDRKSTRLNSSHVKISYA